jgi:hypothetical protein
MVRCCRGVHSKKNGQLVGALLSALFAAASRIRKSDELETLLDVYMRAIGEADSASIAQAA